MAFSCFYDTFGVFGMGGAEIVDKKISEVKLHNVGILTFTYGDNFGQRLQNLAMQEYLKKYLLFDRRKKK